MSTSEEKHRLIMAAFLMTMLYVVSTFFYHKIEGWSVLDSVYFVTTTFTTIGFGDHVPVTEAGKVFTIFIAWIGISTGIYLIYSIIAYREKTVDQEILKKLRTMRDIFRPGDKHRHEDIKRRLR